MALTLKERAKKRFEGLKSTRQPYEDMWREIAQHASPFRSRFLVSDTNKRRGRSNKANYNSHGILAARTLTGGMTSGLSSPSRPWFRLAPYDPDLVNDTEVKNYLDEVEKRMYAFLAQTNFYAAVKSGYHELGMFGTEACVMDEDVSKLAVCHAMTAGEYWISLNSAGEPDTLARTVPFTVNQAVMEFGDRVSPTIRNMYDNSNYNTIVDIVQLIEPNPDQVPGRMDAKGKPWRSMWWDQADGRADWFLRERGYNEQPFWAPRWDTTGGDVYGNSPGMDALPDLRELQMQSLNKNKLAKQIRNPEKVVPATMKLTGEPGNNVAASNTDAAKVLVPYVPDPRALQQVREDIIELKRSVDAMFYADLFNAITNMPGVQPRTVEEIASRNEEKLTQLGPVIERVENEKLAIALERTFAIMMRLRMFDDLPPPEQLAGKHLRFVMVSILAQMQRMVGIGQIERTAGFVGNLAGVRPDALDKLDVDAMVDEYADRAGAPAKMIRSTDDANKLRQDRAQQQQMEKVAAMAQPAKDAATAAELLSRTRTDPGTALSNLTGAFQQ